MIRESGSLCIINNAQILIHDFEWFEMAWCCRRDEWISLQSITRRVGQIYSMAFPLNFAYIFCGLSILPSTVVEHRCDLKAHRKLSATYPTQKQCTPANRLWIFQRFIRNYFPHNRLMHVACHQTISIIHQQHHTWDFNQILTHLECCFRPLPTFNLRWHAAHTHTRHYG